MKPGGSSSKWVCNGKMKGQGTLETDWTDYEHETGTLHFTGTILVGNDTKPVEWTTVSSSVFKSASCGSVKPQPLPSIGNSLGK